MKKRYGKQIWKTGIAVFILCAAWMICGVQAEANLVYQDHWLYQLFNDDSEVVIITYDDTSVTELVIPSEIEGKPVTKIASSAFHFEDGDFENLRKVTIPESVTEIGPEAFLYCINLESVELPTGLTQLGSYAFNHCSKLQNITIPGSVKEIGSNAFQDCIGLKSLTISEGVEKIYDYAFSNCSGLTEIFVPASVQYIADGAFACGNLESINVDEGNENYFSGDGNVIINRDYCKLVAGCKNTILPEEINNYDEFHIAEYAFFGCNELTSIELPDNTTTIGEYAFLECSSLKSITIPGSVKEIGANVFSGCTSLEEINIGAGNPSYSTVDGVMYNKDKTTLVSYPSAKGGAYTIPETVTSIDAVTFENCNNLEEIVLHSKLTSFSPNAIWFSRDNDTSNKIKVTVPEEMDISNLGLENIEAKDHVVIYVAEGSTADLYLEKYKLQITVITYKSGTTKTEDKTENKSGDKTDSSSDSSTGGETKTDSKQENSETAVIGKTYEVGRAKYKVTSVTEVTYTAPKSKSIKKITIPATVTILSKSYKVTAVSKGACKGCKKLTTVTVGKNVKTIGDEAFMNCKKLNKVTVGKSVTSIGKKVFSGDKKLAKLIFKGSKVKKVGKKALSGVPKKVKITAPKKAVPKYKKLLNKAK